MSVSDYSVFGKRLLREDVVQKSLALQETLYSWAQFLEISGKVKLIPRVQLPEHALESPNLIGFINRVFTCFRGGNACQSLEKSGNWLRPPPTLCGCVSVCFSLLFFSPLLSPNQPLCLAPCSVLLGMFPGSWFALQVPPFSGCCFYPCFLL